MNKLRKRSIIALFNLLIILFFFGTSQATVLFYYDAEGGVIGEELPYHQTSGIEFCQPECGSSNPNRGRIRDSISTPNGNKFFEWYCPDATHDAWNTIRVKGTYPIPLTLGKTYYSAYFMRFDALTSKQIWADDQGEKGVEVKGAGIRWITSRGRNAAYHNIPDYNFTVYIGNPSYHLNSEYEDNDVYIQNRNGYSKYNPILLEYGKWYSIVFRFDVINTKTGTVSLYVNGVEVIHYDEVLFTNSTAPTLTELEMGGTIAQPGYNCGEHYRRFDALMLTDNWQDIVNGGYLSESPDPPDPPQDPPGSPPDFSAN
jgi:hypothetical protein